MIALINFNTYLGGGETLFVRLAEYFEKKCPELLLFYKSESYIESDIKKKGINKKHCCPINLPVDYYYLNDAERKDLRNAILSSFDRDVKYEVFSFCARDLYLTTDLTKEESYHIKLAHLILHDQDNLYCCQTLLDKLILKLRGKRNFSSKKMMKFNTNLFREVQSKGVLIPMSEVIVRLWGRYGIQIPKDNIVPLPTCSFPDYSFKPVNNKKILWIGRFVNFKLPSLCAMLNFLKRHPDYSLSVVGYGAEKFVQDYMDKNCIDRNQVVFLGTVDYDKLGEVIQGHAIGYAMGTSIIEMTQYGIPVIMAMASPDYKLFSKDICGGLYVNKSQGNVGVDLFYDNDLNKFPTIDETISSIEGDYLNSAKSSYECIRKMFDFETNAEAYISSLKRGEYIKYKISIPQACLLRKVIFIHLRTCYEHS